MVVPCKLVLFNLFYNCFQKSNLLSYSYISNSSFLDILEDLLRALKKYTVLNILGYNKLSHSTNRTRYTTVNLYSTDI
jgi:predicted choloylglycine hydrolase